LNVICDYKAIEFGSIIVEDMQYEKAEKLTTCSIDDSPGPGDKLNRNFKREMNMFFENH
jgi:hypothetical protein